MTAPPDADDDGTSCLFCGQAEEIWLHEAWTTHEFQIGTCCHGLHEAVVAEMADDPAWGAELLRDLGADALLGHELKRLASDGDPSVLLDFGLQIRPVAFSRAQAFVRDHHAHCGPPIVARFSASVWNGYSQLGVAMVANPVARALCGRGTLEVTRLCVRRDVPAALRRNAASKLLGWCAAETARRGWRHLVTYTRIDEDAASVRAAGFVEESRVRARGWHSRARARSNSNAWVDKVRWGKALRPARQPVLHPESIREAEPPRPLDDARLFG